MKRSSFAARCAMAVLLALGIVAPVTAGELVPLRGNLDGYEEVRDLPPVATILGIGGGEATQLGRFTYELDATIDFEVLPPHGVGILTLTAADGDTLVTAIDGFSTPVIPGLVLLIVEDATIVGGTGRFAGASGSFTITRLKYLDTGDTVGSFEGTISTPSANP